MPRLPSQLWGQCRHHQGNKDKEEKPLLGCQFWLSAAAEWGEIRRCFYSLSAAVRGGNLHSFYIEGRAPLSKGAYVKIAIFTTTRTTTTEPYTQMPRDRIELRPTSAGLIFLPKKAELQEMHPNFWSMIVTKEIRLRTDPAQLDAPLLDALRDKVGIRIQTDDITQAAALLNLDKKDPVFTAGHTQTKL